MSQVYISHKHDFTNGEAKEIANEIALKLAENYAIEYEWEDEVLYFERTGVYGQIEIDDQHILVQAELSFPLNLLQHKVETEVNKIMQAHFVA